MNVADERLRAVLESAAAAWSSRPGLRDAAVLAPFVQRAGVDHVVFTVRRADLAEHAGEVSFPGGRRDGAETPLQCALRESHEEIGLAPDATAVLGALPPRRSGTGFRVHAFVGRAPDATALSGCDREVARLLLVPLVELLDESRWGWRTLGGGHLRWRSPVFEHDGETLWGLTAIFTRDLLARLQRPADPS